MDLDLSQLIELVVLHDDEIKRVFAAVPELKQEMIGELGVKVAEFATRHRSENKEDVIGQAAAIRTEVARLIEEQMGIVLKKRQEIVGLGEITPKLTELAQDAAAKHFKEYARRHREELPKIVRQEFAALPKIETPSEHVSLAASFTGNWESGKLYERDEVFTFRGSSYLVLKAARGILPSQQSQKGADATYGLIAAAGAPGPLTPLPANAALGPLSSTDNAAALWNGTSGALLKNSVTIINPTTGAISGFTTGTGLTLHGGGTITGASGAITLAPASGVNVIIPFLASGSKLQFGVTALATIAVSADTTGGVLTFTAPSSGGHQFVNGNILLATNMFIGWSNAANTGIYGNGSTHVVSVQTNSALSLAISGGAAATLTGGAGSMTITAGTGASRTMTFQTTSGASAAQTNLTLNADLSSTFTGPVSTSAPTGGAGAWELGVQTVSGASVLSTDRYVNIEIGGTLVKLAVVTNS